MVSRPHGYATANRPCMLSRPFAFYGRTPRLYDAAMKWIVSVVALASLCGCSSVVSTRPVGLAHLDLSGEADKWTGTWRAPMGPCAITIVDATNGVLKVTSTKPVGWWRWSNETMTVYLRTAGEWTYASIDCTEGTNTCYLWGKVANGDGIILWWAPDPDKFKPLVESGVLPGTIGKMIKKKQSETQPGFPILGYTSNGEPVYETGVPGGPSEPFTWALDVPEPEMPPETEDEQAADMAPSAAVEAPPMSAGSAMSGFGGDQITLGDLEPAHYELITATSNGVMFAWEAPLVLVKESARTDLRYLQAATKRWMREQGK